MTRGSVLGEAVNAARRMALTPGNDMTPTHLAHARARSSARDAGLDVDVLDEDAHASQGHGLAARRLARLATNPRR